MPEIKTTRLSSKEQATKGQLYSMNLKFTGDVSLKSMDEFLDAVGIQEKPILPHAIELNMTQVVPFIPDKETIKAYEKAIEDSHNNNNPQTSLSNVRFAGYEYLYAVEQTMVSDENYETLRQKVLSMGYEETCAFLEYTIPGDIDEYELKNRMLRKFQSMSPEQYSKCLRRYGIKKENET